MIATNAVPIGCRIGEHRCAACSKAIDLEHVLFDCPAAIAFWQLVLKAWATRLIRVNDSIEFDTIGSS